MKSTFVVEQTRDDSGNTNLLALNSNPSLWNLASQFTDDNKDIARQDAHRAALRLRDAGRNSSGIRPVVRVREILATGGSVIELCMQRLAYRQKRTSRKH